MWLDRFRSVQVREPNLPEASAMTDGTFVPRAARFRLEAPITFTVDDHPHEGQCLNVSDSGVLASFEELPELWVYGQLSLEAGDHYISIHAKVARIQGRNVGFAFLIEGENDRAAISILVQSVANDPLPDTRSDGF